VPAPEPPNAIIPFNQLGIKKSEQPDVCCYVVDTGPLALELILTTVVALAAVILLRESERHPSLTSFRAYAPRYNTGGRSDGKAWAEMYRWFEIRPGLHWLIDRAGKIVARAEKVEGGAWQLIRESASPQEVGPNTNYATCEAAKRIVATPLWGWIAEKLKPTESGIPPLDGEGNGPQLQRKWWQ
jgi:hypothetical protein